VCYDVNVDVDNCGSIGRKCDSDQNGNTTCNRGTCDVSCIAGYKNSNGKCLSENESANDCGPNSLICTGPPNSTPRCSNSKCEYTCNTPYVLRWDVCVDTSSDVNYCGPFFFQCTSQYNGEERSFFFFSNIGRRVDDIDLKYGYTCVRS
jgi:hypothetical protein